MLSCLIALVVPWIVSKICADAAWMPNIVNALIYGFEESLGGPFKKQGLDIKAIETWPVEKINWIPEELKEKLIPPIQKIFKGFRKELEVVSDS